MNITFVEAIIVDFYIHQVGNKLADEKYFISQRGIELTQDLRLLLSHHFLSSFKSLEELYSLHHSIDISLNEVYSCVSQIFENPANLYEQSINLAKHLYDQSAHPKIKSGEFYTVYFKDCILDGEMMDAIGLFKSENKDTFIETEQINNGFEIDSRKGININKLDKGCLIFNTNKDNGYMLSIVDNTSKGGDAQYWKNDFLSVQPIKTEYHQTNQFLGIAKQFVTQKLANEWDTIDKSEILGRSLDYFKNNEVFDKQKFEEEVFQDEAIIESFRNFDEIYRKQNELTELTDSFEISSQAVKKQARAFKSVLKLDKNFHIYIHGSRDLIEKGIDENGRKFYKIFYDEEL